MRAFAIVTGMVLFFLPGWTMAEAACVEKKNGEAHLIALVPDTDTNRFADKGFVPTTCPDNYTGDPALAESWCSSFETLPADRRSRFQASFGITTGQVCQAARDYYAGR